MLLGGLIVWVANAVIRWLLAAPLGHDEARYALDAQELLAGHPSRFLYSAGGMSLVAIPGLLLGGTERAVRLVPMLLGLVFLFAAWYLARCRCGRTTAAWTVAVLASSPQMAVHSSELLSDLPSATCLVLAITILAHELTRDGGLRRRIVAVAPLCAAAFYLRYGSCVSVAIIGAVFAIVGYRAIVRRPWPVVATVVLLALLLVPHVARSAELTGDATGILQLSAEIPGQAQGIAAYISSPVGKYGVLVAALLVIGVVAVRRDRDVLALQLVALAQIVVLASITQAQPRFIYLATVLLIIVAVDAVRRGVTRTSGHVRTGIIVACVGAISASWLNELHNGLDHRDTRMSGAWRALVAATAIKSDRDPRIPCEVVAASDVTRLEWYSGCRGDNRPSGGPGQLYEVRDGAQVTVPAGSTIVAFLPGLLDVIRIR